MSIHIPREQVEQEIRTVHLTYDRFATWLATRSAARSIVGVANSANHCPLCFYLLQMCPRDPTSIAITDPIIGRKDDTLDQFIVRDPAIITIFFELGIEPIEIAEPPVWVSWFIHLLDTSYQRIGPRAVRARDALDILNDARNRTDFPSPQRGQ